MEARVISYPNTLPMCCPTGDGAAAIVLVSDSKLKTLSLEQQRRAVKISASVLTSDPWTEGAQVQPDVNTLTRNAANAGVRDGRRRPVRPQPGGVARLLRDRRADPLRQPRVCASAAVPATSSTGAVRGVTARAP